MDMPFVLIRGMKLASPRTCHSYLFTEWNWLHHEHAIRTGFIANMPFLLINRMKLASQWTCHSCLFTEWNWLRRELRPASLDCMLSRLQRHCSILTCPQRSNHKNETADWSFLHFFFFFFFFCFHGFLSTSENIWRHIAHLSLRQSAVQLAACVITYSWSG